MHAMNIKGRYVKFLFRDNDKLRKMIVALLSILVVFASFVEMRAIIVVTGCL